MRSGPHGFIAPPHFLSESEKTLFVAHVTVCFGLLSSSNQSRMSFLVRLIDEVRARPFLWDSNLESYRDAILKDKAWGEIAVMLGKPKNDIKLEWKKLRDRHRQAMHRKKTKSEQAAAKAKPWIYEKKMEFIQRKFNYTQNEPYTPSHDPNDDPEEEQDEEIEENSMLEINIMSDEADTVSLASNALNPRESWNNQPTEEDQVLNYLREKQNSMKSQAEPDDLDLFFASMCKTTRRLPRFLQSRVKMEVLQVIAKAEEFEWNSQRPHQYQRFLSSPSSSSPQISSALPDTASLDRVSEH